MPISSAAAMARGRHRDPVACGNETDSDGNQCDVEQRNRDDSGQRQRRHLRRHRRAQHVDVADEREQRKGQESAEHVEEKDARQRVETGCGRHSRHNQATPREARGRLPGAEAPQCRQPRAARRKARRRTRPPRDRGRSPRRRAASRAAGVPRYSALTATKTTASQAAAQKRRRCSRM